MKHALGIATAATMLLWAQAAVSADHSSFVGIWSAPGESCSEDDPSESIMIVSMSHIDFLEVGCDITGVPGPVTADAMRFDLTCSGIDSGPWTSALVLQELPGNMVLQAFDGDDMSQQLKRCPH